MKNRRKSDPGLHSSYKLRYVLSDYPILARLEKSRIKHMSVERPIYTPTTQVTLLVRQALSLQHPALHHRAQLSGPAPAPARFRFHLSMPFLSG